MPRKVGPLRLAGLVGFYCGIALFDTVLDSIYQNSRAIVSTHPAVPHWALFAMDGAVVLVGLLVIFFQAEFTHSTSPAERSTQVLTRFTCFYIGLSWMESGLMNLYRAGKDRAFPGFRLREQQLLSDLVAAGFVSLFLFYSYRFSTIQDEVLEADKMSSGLLQQRAPGGPPQDCLSCRSKRGGLAGTPTR